MGDGTADGVRVDSLAEWQAAAEEVRRLERVAQGKRETLLSAARADALAQGELGAGRRLLAGLERSLIAGTALAGPSPLRAGLNATRAEINGAARKVPVEDWGGADFALPPATGWQADKLTPRGPVVENTTDIFTVTPASDAPLQPGDRVTIEQAQAHLDKAISNMGKLVNDDAPSTDYYADPVKQHINFAGSLTQHADGRVETTGPTKLQPAKPRRGAPVNHIEKQPEASPADYWSGAARNPRRWWQVWRKK